MTKDKRFLWTCTETLYSNTPEGGTGLLTEPCIASVYGEKGERGEKYLGHYTDSQTAYEDNTPDLFSGDYYLNTKDSYIYVYIEEDNAWAKITDFSDYRYNQSINDIFEAIESSTQKENFIRAKKIWVQNIAAAVARTETLFSNKITLTQGTDLDGKSAGGIIQSANYASGKSGWKIGYDGNAEFNNATVRGKIYATEGEFKGAITGGTIKIGENFSVDSNGNVTANKGTFGDKCNFEGFLIQNNLAECSLGFVTFVYNNSKTYILKRGSNLKYVLRYDTGKYVLFFTDISPVASNKWDRICLYPINIFTSDSGTTKGSIESGTFYLWGSHKFQNSVHFASASVNQNQAYVDDSGNISGITFNDTGSVYAIQSYIDMNNWGMPAMIQNGKIKFTSSGNVYSGFIIGLCITDRNTDSFQDPTGGCVLGIKAYGIGALNA